LARASEGDEFEGLVSRERFALLGLVEPVLDLAAGGDADGMLWLGEELLGAPL